jgi:hypothetical protein
MRTALALALVLATAACRKATEVDGPSPTSFEWSQTSPDGKFELRQKREATGCQVQAVVRPGEKPLWTSRICLPAPSGLFFLNSTGEKLLVLDLFPSGAQTPDWSKVTLAALWTRGAVSRQYTGAELLAADRATDMRSVLSWLKGDAYDEVRTSARMAGNGTQVSVDLVDGRTILLGFEGAAAPLPPALSVRPVARADEPVRRPEPAGAEADAVPTPPPAQADAALAADEAGLYRWEDEQGDLHFSQGAQIPAKYRKRAVPVHATVGVMEMATGAKPPQAGQPGQPPGAPGAPGASGQPGQPGQPGTQPAPGAKPAGAPAAGTPPPAPGTAEPPAPPR